MAVATWLVMVVMMVMMQSVHSHPMIQREISNPAFDSISQHLDPEGKHLSEDDSLEAVLLNYLYAKQMVERLRNSQDISDLTRKRSYWKQCAFNAVSCFGKK
ncbi:Allatostatin C Type 2 Precursor protein [Hyalella azteca]|nr:Allatostatin C Type 2 Precursor protein [Hyalella azteca]